MDEIDLGEQLGKGGFGMVYKGTWRGAPVAVKCGPCATDKQEDLERSLREVVLAKHMSHPNVVQTYAWTLLTGEQANNMVRPPRPPRPLRPPRVRLCGQPAHMTLALCTLAARLHEALNPGRCAAARAAAVQPGLSDSTSKVASKVALGLRRPEFWVLRRGMSRAPRRCSRRCPSPPQ